MINHNGSIEDRGHDSWPKTNLRLNQVWRQNPTADLSTERCIRPLQRIVTRR